MSLSKSRVLGIAVALAIVGPAPSLSAATAADIAPAATAGASASLSADGSFAVDFTAPAYHFGGDVGHPVTDVMRRAGHDRTGAYTEIDFTYRTADARSGSIRTYENTPVAVFTTTYPGGGANTEPFPVLSTYPTLPYQQTYHGCFSAGQFNTVAGAADSPWLSFDRNADGFMLSPASHFPVAHTWRTGDGALASGIDPAIASVP